MELGEGGDHDQPYTRSLSPSGPHVLAWTKLRPCESVVSWSHRRFLVPSLSECARKKISLLASNQKKV